MLNDFYDWLVIILPLLFIAAVVVLAWTILDEHEEREERKTEALERMAGLIPDEEEQDHG